MSDDMEVVEGDVEEIDAFRYDFDELETEYNASPNKEAFIQRYEKVLYAEKDDEDAVKIKETAVYRLTKIHTDAKHFDNLMTLLKSCSHFFTIIPKAKTAKIVRNMLEIVGTSGDMREVSIALCRNIIEWCVSEKRNFLRQRIESKLATLLLLTKQTQEALNVVNSLLKELKKLDDKQMLTEVHLTESRIYHALLNIPKSKSSLTAARTNANSIYVAPVLQGELDEMSGTLYCEEGDNTTAYSYFQEAFDAYDSSSDPRAIKTLQYMALCKVLSNHPEEVKSLFNTKTGMKYIGPQLEAISDVAKSAIAKSLDQFKATIASHHDTLYADDLIAHHIEILYDKMFESNLIKILSPYSSVEVSHVAKIINLEVAIVEKKLSQMILNRRFHGILDQGKGVLDIFEETAGDVAYTKSYEIIANMETVVDNLFERVRGLTVVQVKPEPAVVVLVSNKTIAMK